MADKILSLQSDYEIIVTKKNQAISNKNRDLSSLTCSHEEADTRMFVHARHAIISGAKRITMRVTDTDILVIAISLFKLLQDDGIVELWLNFGKKSSQKFIPNHTLVTSLTPECSVVCCSSTLLLVVILFQHSETTEKSHYINSGMQHQKFHQLS